jgi:hypothetical protein
VPASPLIVIAASGSSSAQTAPRHDCRIISHQEADFGPFGRTFSDYGNQLGAKLLLCPDGKEL